MSKRDAAELETRRNRAKVRHIVEDAVLGRAPVPLSVYTPVPSNPTADPELPEPVAVLEPCLGDLSDFLVQGDLFLKQDPHSSSSNIFLPAVPSSDPLPDPLPVPSFQEKEILHTFKPTHGNAGISTCIVSQVDESLLSIPAAELQSSLAAGSAGAEGVSTRFMEGDGALLGTHTNLTSRLTPENTLTVHDIVHDYWKDFLSLDRSYDEPSSDFDESKVYSFTKVHDVWDTMNFVESETSSHEPVTSKDEELYRGARISIQESLTAILLFTQTEHLTGVGLGRLLQLIDVHLPATNNLAKSAQDFYSALGRTETECNINYYCSHCWSERSSLNDLCQSCTDPHRTVHYFISFSIAAQLSKLYSRPDFLDLINYKNKRTKININNIEDIYDSGLYKEAECAGLGPHDVTLMWNTDGVNIYESSSFDLYPFYLVVNELPPEERFKSENVILAGVWGSKDKPHPNLFLKKTAIELDSLRNTGLSVDTPEKGELNVKVFTLYGTCDSPAKSCFFNMKGHSGYFSCPKCMTKGEKSIDTEEVMAFPFEEDLILRDDLYQSQVACAIETKTDFQGIKGPTLLHYMLLFSMFRSTAIDSMHCLYIGVVKQLLNLWFSASHHSKPFSLSKRIEEVNKYLSEIKLPHYVQRIPVGVDKLPFWKASLCHNFFFICYCLY